MTKPPLRLKGSAFFVVVVLVCFFPSFPGSVSSLCLQQQQSLPWLSCIHDHCFLEVVEVIRGTMNYDYEKRLLKTMNVTPTSTVSKGLCVYQPLLTCFLIHGHYSRQHLRFHLLDRL